jgi:hypothetical protein
MQCGQGRKGERRAESVAEPALALASINRSGRERLAKNRSRAYQPSPELGLQVSGQQVLSQEVLSQLGHHSRRNRTTELEHGRTRSRWSAATLQDQALQIDASISIRCAPSPRRKLTRA